MTLNSAAGGKLDDGFDVAKLLSYLVALVAIGTSLVIIWYAFFGVGIPRKFITNVVLGGSLTVYYLNTVRKNLADDALSSRPNVLLNIVWPLLLSIAAVVAASYVYVHFDRWQTQGQLLIYTTTDLAVGATLIVLVSDVMFRSFGRALGSVVVVSVLFGYFGDVLPGILGHSGLGLEMLVFRQTIALSGIFGTLAEIGATWVAIFIIFAAFVEAYGGFEYIERIGLTVSNVNRNAVPQASIVSSMFVGMMMGGAAVNVATTGSFTIPFMKEQGVPNRVSAAIESLASSGGQILPPIMGLAAFLIADVIGIHFGEVIVAGTLPALLFYLCVSTTVFIWIKKHGWLEDVPIDESGAGQSAELGETNADDQSLASTVLEGSVYLIPLIVLLYCLVGLRISIMRAGGYTIITFLAVRFVYLLLSDGISLAFVRQLIEGLEKGTVNLAPFMGLLAALGIVVDLLIFSGVGQKIGSIIITASTASLFVILVLAMIVSLLFGLGMPTPAAYLVVALIVAPSLVQAGVPLMGAHFFVFYFALLSAITPPIAVAVAVACGIAECSFLEAAKETLIMGLPLFFIPYLFIANPSLIVVSFPISIVTFVAVALALSALIFSITGSNSMNDLSIPHRLAFFGLFLLIGFGHVVVGYKVAQTIFAVIFLLACAPIFRSLYSSGTRIIRA